MGTLLVVGVIAGLLIFAGSSESEPTIELGRPEGGKWAEYDTVHLGRRGLYEYAIVYTPNDEKPFTLMVRRAYDSEIGPIQEYTAETIAGSFDTVLEAEQSAIELVNASVTPPGFEILEEGLVPPLEVGEESRAVSAGTDGVYTWEVYYVAGAPQPYVVNLGVDPERLVTIGTAPNSTEAALLLEEFLAVHARPPSGG